MIRIALALLLALLAGADGDDPWWITDPWACPEPEEPNCGAPNGAGGWPEEPDPAPAEPAAPAPAPPTYTG